MHYETETLSTKHTYTHVYPHSQLDSTIFNKKANKGKITTTFSAPSAHKESNKLKNIQTYEHKQNLTGENTLKHINIGGNSRQKTIMQIKTNT